MILLDVDGVLTDGTIAYHSDDEVIVNFNVKDGLGIKLAQAGGIPVGIISGRSSKALQKRVEELGIDIFYQAQHDKLEAYEKIKQIHAIDDDQVLYIGDDLNDLKILQKVGFKVSVQDGCNEIKEIADYVTEKPGGKGAVREVVELVLKSQGMWEQLMSSL